MAYMIIYKSQSGLTTTAFFNTLDDVQESYRLVNQDTAELYEKSEDGYKRIS